MPDFAHSAENRPSPSSAQRSYLMCPPTFFDVSYKINPWMDPGKPVDAALAMVQWERIRDLFRRLGHRVELIEPMPGLPDMVFAANGATVVDGRAFLARFRYPERAPEADAYRRWLETNGFPVVDSAYVNEGEGDLLVVGDRILAGTGFRTDTLAHEQLRRVFGREVVTLTLVDPRFYHLDTALAVLRDELVMYYPQAFDAQSQARLAELFPDAILADRADAEAFGLNAVSDGHTVVLAHTATGLIQQLRSRGLHPIGVDISELLRAGGAVKCCTLELRHPAATAG